MARLMVGTSGFAYREWKPEFYPAELKNTEMLGFYSRELPSVEINNTFYRAPTPKLLASWIEQTPQDFAFTLKAPQRITHFQRLREVDENLSYFLQTARALEARLGAILFQLPPTLRYDAELLDSFLAALPGDPYRFAMEFRHASWDAAEVHEKLAANHVSLCVADTDDTDAAMVRTARDFVYLRLRKLAYDDDSLASWEAHVRAAIDDGSDVYCYFKHEDDPSGVRYAQRLREMIE